MKTAFLIFITFGVQTIVLSQFYNKTGKNLGLYLSASPVNSIQIKENNLSANSYQFSAGFIKMIYSGIYPKLGYGYASFKDNNNTIFTTKGLHTLNMGVLLDINLFDFGQRKVGSTCHSIKCGLTLTPEYRFALKSGTVKNYSIGEFSGEIGLSFCHVTSSPRKANRSKTRHYDFYFRNGFTPLYITQEFSGNDKYMSKEIGFRVRFMFHKVYDFLK
jgi:hypothetical protein